MPDSNIETSHLDPTRADAARRAGDQVVQAAHAWATAPKRTVGAVSLPGDSGAARAFDAFHEARRQLAYHVGGEAAARWASGALSTAAAQAPFPAA
jgi:hypothetical protein